MFTIVIPFAVLWTLCSSGRKFHDDYYYYPLNVSRSTPSGIAAYRSALTLDWLSAEDTRQREMVAAIESEPLPPSRISHSDCISYARPPSGAIARLMLEMLKNLEGDDGLLIPGLIQALVRAKLLVLETSIFDNEPDLEALVKTPTAMMGEPHTTFPRILATLWLAVTDPTTVKKHGWCTVNKMTTFILATKPSDIAQQMKMVEQTVARVRFMMEEFIQHVTPLNMLQRVSTSKSTRKYKPVAQKSRGPTNTNYKRPVRTQPVSPTKTTPFTTVKELLKLPDLAIENTDPPEPMLNPNYDVNSKEKEAPTVPTKSFSMNLQFVYCLFVLTLLVL